MPWMLFKVKEYSQFSCDNYPDKTKLKQGLLDFRCGIDPYYCGIQFNGTECLKLDKPCKKVFFSMSEISNYAHNSDDITYGIIRIKSELIR